MKRSGKSSLGEHGEVQLWGAVRRRAGGVGYSVQCLAGQDARTVARDAISKEGVEGGSAGGGAAEVVEKYKSNPLEGILLRYLADEIWKLIHAADRAENNGLGRKAAGGLGGGRKDEAYEDMIEAARALNRRPGWQAQALTRKLLNDSFPSWFPWLFGRVLSLFPTWFDAKHASVSTVLLTGWLVGPAAVVDADVAILDDEDRVRGPGWGNEPTGWVPGFALGGLWRKEAGAGHSVLIERCRVLEQVGCASVCANVCKAPTQAYFTRDIGLPLTMTPDYETLSCTLTFGATPPALENDPAFASPCLTQCPEKSAHGGRRGAVAALDDDAPADVCGKLVGTSMKPPEGTLPHGY